MSSSRLNTFFTVSFKSNKGHNTDVYVGENTSQNVKYGAEAFVCVVCAHVSV